MTQAKPDRRRRALQFWFDFASTYSYLTAMRIDAMAAERGVDIDWRPFLLGPIFAAQGWSTSPFNLYPAKGRYMIRDLTRLAEARGLPFKMPATFPANSLLASRIAIQGRHDGWTPAISRAIFAAQFGHGADIADPAVLASVVKAQGLESETILEGAGSPSVKLALREATDTAMASGIFGAPTFRTTDGEVFWGDDRLDAALTWEASSPEE